MQTPGGSRQKHCHGNEEKYHANKTQVVSGFTVQVVNYKLDDKVESYDEDKECFLCPAGHTLAVKTEASDG